MALDGVLVLDFTRLLPGPLATLMLADMGATVVRVRRTAPDGMRAAPLLHCTLHTAHIAFARLAIIVVF